MVGDIKEKCMRKFGKYKGKLVRFSPAVDKITLLDHLLHLFGMHLIRKSVENVIYCRLCGNIRDVENKQLHVHG